MQSRTLPVQAGRHSVEILEAGTGPDLVFLHGAGGLMWDPFLEELSQSFHVIAPKLAGTGKSTGDDEILDHHDTFYYLLDAIDGAGAKNPVLIGHSMGGWLAAELAALQPERFKKLVLIAPAGLWNDDYPVFDFFIYRSMPKELAPRIFADINHPGAQAMMGPAPTDPEVIKTMMVESSRNYIAAAKLMWPIPDKGLKKRIHRITAPTLIIWGKQDGLVPVQYAQDFQKAIAGSKVEIIDGAGHLPQVEQATAVMSAVKGFLA